MTKLKRKRREEVPPEEVLKGWHTLHYHLRSLSKEECLNLLKYELANASRILLVNRLIARACHLHSDELREELELDASKCIEASKNRRQREGSGDTVSTDDPQS